MQLEGKSETQTAAVALLANYLTEEQLAEELGKNERTVARWRALRKGPPFVVIGREIRYRREAIEKWLLDCERGFEKGPARRSRA